jgi:hypothetical protein
MKAQLWVEAHQPVPLVPLSMLRVEPGDVVFIGKYQEKVTGDRLWDKKKDDALQECFPIGWFQAGPNGVFVSLDTADYFWDNFMDYEKSMGRRLQPDESVLVRYTSR